MDTIAAAKTLADIHDRMNKTVFDIFPGNETEQTYFLMGRCMALEDALCILGVQYFHTYVKEDGKPLLQKDIKQVNGVPVFTRRQEYFRRYHIKE